MDENFEKISIYVRLFSTGVLLQSEGQQVWINAKVESFSLTSRERRTVMTSGLPNPLSLFVFSGENSTVNDANH